LLLATSQPRDLPCPPDELLGRVLDGDQEIEREAQPGDASGLGEGIDRQASRVFPDGRRGALQALAAAHEMVVSGGAPSCYVGGVDSLLDPLRLNELLLDKRLLDAGSDGFVPGEAAAFIKLEARAAANPRCALLGSAITGGSRADATPGEALAQAAQLALREARTDASSLAALVHDGSSEQAIVEEIALAITRLPFQRPAVQLPRWVPAFSVGETGAAAAFLSLAMSAFFMREKIFGGPVLVWLISEAADRGALVVGAP
jgi:3-oxoacyl-(acyl-carrier-protein) synthase